MKLIRALVFFLFLVVCGSADAYENLSVGLGGGYGGNLFADSFQIGNSYLTNSLSFSSVNFQAVKFRLRYDLSYTNYNTDNFINNVIHTPGIALYNRDRDRRLKWGINALATLKDYVDKNSNFDNYRFFGIADASYYIKSFLQAKALYKFTRSRYDNYASLDNIEHWVEAELVATLPSKSTLRGGARYGVRQFDEELITFHWYDTEFGFSQSLDARTGLGITCLRRWSKGGTRPLSSYYIISGITSFWDPWKGDHVEIFVKRILPLGVLSRLEAGYWNRRFAYDDILRAQLGWLDDRYGRRDEGWTIRIEINRQQNLAWRIARSIKIGLAGGYSSNGSDDPYYEYNNFAAQTMIEIQIF